LTTFRQQISQLEVGYWLPYNNLKRQYRRIDAILSGDESLSDIQIQGLIDLIMLNERKFQSELSKITSKPGSSNSWFSFWPGGQSSSANYSQLRHMDDIEFMNKLALDIKRRPAYKDAADSISGKATLLLGQKLRGICKTSLNTIREYLRGSAQTKLETQFLKRQKYEEEHSWSDLRIRLQKALIESAPEGSKSV
jgi:hypothetical protein